MVESKREKSENGEGEFDLRNGKSSIHLAVQSCSRGGGAYPNVLPRLDLLTAAAHWAVAYVLPKDTLLNQLLFCSLKESYQDIVDGKEHDHQRYARWAQDFPRNGGS